MDNVFLKFLSQFRINKIVGMKEKKALKLTVAHIIWLSVSIPIEIREYNNLHVRIFSMGI